MPLLKLRDSGVKLSALFPWALANTQSGSLLAWLSSRARLCHRNEFPVGEGPDRIPWRDSLAGGLGTVEGSLGPGPPPASPDSYFNSAGCIFPFFFLNSFQSYLVEQNKL